MKEVFQPMIEFIVGVFLLVGVTLFGLLVCGVLLGLLIGLFGWARSVWNEVRR